MYSYTHNGVYLVDYFDAVNDICQVRNYYTNQCIICKDALALPEWDCRSCQSNRIISGTSCVCPDPAFTNEFDDEYKCSY